VTDHLGHASLAPTTHLDRAARETVTLELKAANTVVYGWGFPSGLDGHCGAK